MAEIKFRNLISTASGVGATTGKETAQYFNENFKITKENLEAIWTILNMTVSSPNVEGIRIRPVMNPDNNEEVLYSLFEYNLDGDLENGEWYPLEVLFENIEGDVFQNPQLKEIIEGLTPLNRFIPIETQVGANTSQISQNKTNIELLQENDNVQDERLKTLEYTTDQHEESLRTKANQVLETFDIIAKGRGYKAGTTIMDQAGVNVVKIESVDENGGILSVSLSSDETANAYYPVINNGGFNYKVGDIVESNDPSYHIFVNTIDANGSIINATLTNGPITETIGQNADIDVVRGEDAIVSTLSYPTIYFQSVNDGLQDKIIYYLNGDLTTPHEIVAYPDFVNVQKIIDETTVAYYSTTYQADCEFALDYAVGDSFNIDGTTWTGMITDISTDPYLVSTDIPVNVLTNVEGLYTTTSTTGMGTGLRIRIGTEFHPQTTTNEEFNKYMDSHDLYIMDLIKTAVNNAVVILDAKINLKADQADFEDHINDFRNPHKVTKEQIGLGNVDNTADKDKPISSSVQTELNLINAKFSNIKQMKVVSKKYYDYLCESLSLEPNILYNVGNYNTTFVTDTSLDESNITHPYANGDVLQVNGTNWQVVILDTTKTPMIYSTNVDATTEKDISGVYTLSSLTGAGEGLLLNITVEEW